VIANLIGIYTTWVIGDYEPAHKRDTYQPSSTMRWHSDILNSSNGDVQVLLHRQV